MRVQLPAKPSISSALVVWSTRHGILPYPGVGRALLTSFAFVAVQVYALLGRPEGATRREIEQLTGWQRHSVRGFLSASVRKQGYKLRTFLRTGERVYRLKG